MDTAPNVKTLKRKYRKTSEKRKREFLKADEVTIVKAKESTTQMTHVDEAEIETKRRLSLLMLVYVSAV